MSKEVPKKQNDSQRKIMWNPEWEEVLKKLFESGELDSNNIKKETLEPLRKKHFPTYLYKNLSALVRRKAAKLRVAEAVDGHRKRKADVAEENSTKDSEKKDTRKPAAAVKKDPPPKEQDQEDDVSINSSSDEEDSESQGSDNTPEQSTTKQQSAPSSKNESDEEDLVEAFNKKASVTRMGKQLFNIGGLYFVAYQYVQGANDQNMVRVDILIPAMSEDEIDLAVCKDGKALLFSSYCPVAFFTPKRLTSSRLPSDVRLDPEHHVPKSLARQGRKILTTASSSMNDTQTGLKGKPVEFPLPVAVDLEIKLFTIGGFGQDNKVMRDLQQGRFVLSVILEDAVKPKMLQKKKGKMRLFASPLQGGNSDDDSEEETPPTAWPDGEDAAVDGVSMLDGEY